MIQHFESQGLGAVEAARRATAGVMHQIQVQAAMLSYLDVFILLMIGSAVALALTAFLKTIDLSRAQMAG
jgi:hypothetical protein